MSFQACAELLRRGDPERFMATMAAPVALRPALFAVYAFNLEVARASFVTAEPMIAEIRLQWWADVLDEIRSGAAVRRHEVATPLAEVLNETAAGYLADLIAARALDARTEPLAGWDEAGNYILRTSGNLMAAAAAVCGTEQGFEAVQGYGSSTGTAAYLIGQPAMAAQGRHRWDGFDDLDTIVNIARKALQEARATRAVLPKQAIPAGRAAWLSAMRLREIARRPETLAEGGPRISEFRARADLLWRSLARRA